MKFSKCILGFLIFATFVSCLKDEVDVSLLNTNALDPDYSGEQFIVLGSTRFDSVWVATINPPRYVKNLDFFFHIKRSLFNQLPPYGCEIQSTNSNFFIEATQGFVNDDNFQFRDSDVIEGQEYCYDIRLKIFGTYTRSYTICGIAE